MFVSSRMKYQLNRVIREQAVQQLRVGGTTQNWLEQHSIRHYGSELMLNGIKRRFTTFQQDQARR